MSSLIFKASCENNTIILKTLIEMMSQISCVDNLEESKKEIKQISLKIEKDHLELFSDTNKVVTSSAIILKNFFKEFNFEEEMPLCIGISFDVLKNSFKNISRNDNFVIEIKREEYTNFPSKIEFTFNNTKGFILKFNLVQNIETSSYEDYHPILTMESSKYCNLYKEIGGSKKIVNFAVEGSKIRFTSSMVDIAENWVEFNINNAQNICTESTLKSEHFKITSKISQFDNYMTLLIDNKANILLKSNIVNLKESRRILGNICINITTKRTT